MTQKTAIAKIIRLLKSPVALLVVLLVIAEFFAYSASLESGKDLANNDDRIDALRAVIQSETNPDVVILGSSLTVTALTYPDFNLGLSPMNDLNSNYTQSRLLTRLFKEISQKEIKAANLSCLAATPADANLIVSELFRRKKKPQLIIYGIEPRAMADNLTPIGGALGGKAALELDPYYESCGLIEKTHISFHKLVCTATPLPVKNYFGDLSKKLGRLGDNPKAEDVQNTVISHFWRLYQVKNTISSLMQNQAQSLLSHQKRVDTPEKVECVPENLKVSEKTGQDKPWDTVSPERIKKQLEQYKAHYLPANQVKMTRNKEMLEKMALLCKQNGVTLCLVKMPISKENRELVAADIARGYDENLDFVAQEFGCKLIDLREGFEQSDFMDTVHLNAKGGEKFQKKLVSRLESAIQ